MPKVLSTEGIFIIFFLIRNAVVTYNKYALISCFQHLYISQVYADFKPIPERK
jgi:hypothetical protein